MSNKTKLMVYIEIDENDAVSVSVENLNNYYVGDNIPPYTGPLSVSLQSPDWISCTSDEKLESWYTHYTEKEL
jgi:hypothetical protein